MMYRSPLRQKVVPTYTSSPIMRASISLDSQPHSMLLKCVFANFIVKRLASNYSFSYILMTKCSILKIFKNVLQWQQFVKLIKIITIFVKEGWSGQLIHGYICIQFYYLNQEVRVFDSREGHQACFNQYLRFNCNQVTAFCSHMDGVKK